MNGYFLVNGVCKDYSPKCVQGNTQNGCITCAAEYQPINGLCTKLPPNCLRIIGLNTCSSCSSNYVLYQGSCYKSIPNCINQNGPFCTQCENLYLESSDRKSCESKQPIRYCRTHDSTFELCMVC